MDATVPIKDKEMTETALIGTSLKVAETVAAVAIPIISPTPKPKRTLLSLYCKSCEETFNEDKFSPKIMPCGHTICKMCFDKLLNTSEEDSVSCPLCGKKSRIASEAPLNYEIISMLNSSKVENSCPTHINESLIFYCQSDELLICQYCLLDKHIGHKIIKPLDSELSKFIKASKEIAETKENLNKYKELILNRNFELVLENNFGKFFTDFENIRMSNKYSVVCEYRKLKKFQDHLKNFDISMNHYYEKIKQGNRDNGVSDEQYVNEFQALESEYKKLSNVTENLDRYFIFNKLKAFNERLATLSEEVKSQIDLTVLNEPKYSDIDNVLEYLISDKHDIIRYKVKSNKDHINLVNTLSNRTEESNEFIVNIMKSVDRVDFVPNGSQNVYQDNPLLIGWNTTISAPYMHLLTLAYLFDVVKSLQINSGTLKAIDIGCGSGYITLCISKLLGPNSVTIGLDHIDAITEFAKNNIKKNHSYYINSGRVTFTLMDGRYGYPEGGPYNLIHVGAAVTDVPLKLLDQLALGGVMWIPVGPKYNYKTIFLIKKNMQGEITKTELLSVSYAEMVSREEQLEDDEIQGLISEDDLLDDI